MSMLIAELREPWIISYPLPCNSYTIPLPIVPVAPITTAFIFLSHYY